MATIYDLKPKFQGLLRPLANKLAAAGVTANQVTLFACAWSIAHGLLIALNPTSRLLLVLLPVTLFIRMALNAIDGMLAREHGQKSKLGAILNELTDVVSDAALYLPLALVAGLAAVPIVIAALLAGLSEMTGVVAQAIGAGRRYDGPMGKSDRAFAFGLLAFLLGIGFAARLMDHALSVGHRCAACAYHFQSRFAGAQVGGQLMTQWIASTFGLPLPVVYAVLGVYGILIVSSLLVWILQKKSGGAQGELAARVKSWWVMVTVFRHCRVHLPATVSGLPWPYLLPGAQGIFLDDSDTQD